MWLQNQLLCYAVTAALSILSSDATITTAVTGVEDCVWTISVTDTSDGNNSNTATDTYYIDFSSLEGQIFETSLIMDHITYYVEWSLCGDYLQCNGISAMAKFNSTIYDCLAYTTWEQAQADTNVTLFFDQNHNESLLSNEIVAMYAQISWQTKGKASAAVNIQDAIVNACDYDGSTNSSNDLYRFGETFEFSILTNNRIPNVFMGLEYDNSVSSVSKNSNSDTNSDAIYVSTDLPCIYKVVSNVHTSIEISEQSSDSNNKNNGKDKDGHVAALVIIIIVFIVVISAIAGFIWYKKTYGAKLKQTVTNMEDLPRIHEKPMVSDYQGM